MKKVILGMVAMASMAMVSCTQDEEQLGMTDMSGIKFTGSIEEVMSRTSMNNDGKVIWCETDPISIFMRNGHHYKYQSTTGGSVSTTFTYANWYSKGNATLDQNYAVYPYAEGNAIDASAKKITVDLSGLAEQTYTENSFEEGKSVMTAKSTNTDLPFFNALSMLLVRLNSDVPEAYTIKSIKIESSSLALNGTSATIDMNASDGKPAAVLASGNKVNTLDCGDGVVISTDPTDFFILVPANSVPAGDFTITITATDEFTGEEYTKIETIASAFEFKRSIYTIYERTLTSESWTGSIEADTWDGEEGEAWGDDELAADVIEIASAQDLANFAATVNGGNSLSGKTVKLTGNIDLANQPWTPIGDCNSSKYFQGTFDGQGNTILNLNVDKSTDTDEHSSAGLFGWVDAAMATIQNVKVDNATVKGSHWVGVIAGYFTGRIENCTVTNSTVEGFNVNDKANGDKVAGIVGCLNESSYLNGNTVSNTTIKGNRDIGGIAGSVAASTIEMKNNKVTDVTLTYTTPGNSGGVEYASAGIFVSGRTGYVADDTNTSSNVTIKYNGTVASSDDLAKLIAAGTDEVTLASGTYTIPNAAKGETLIINGTKDVIINANYDYGQNISGATITFNGVTVSGQTSGDYAGITHVGPLTFNNCTFEGKVTLYSTTVFNQCTFNNKSDYAIWTWGAPTVTFTDCTFNSGGKALLLYGGANGQTAKVLNVENCKFYSDKSCSSKKAAIETGQDYGATYEINIKNTTAKGFSVTEASDSQNYGGTSLGTELWGNKTLMTTANLNVIVDGVDVY